MFILLYIRSTYLVLLSAYSLFTVSSFCLFIYLTPSYLFILSAISMVIVVYFLGMVCYFIFFLLVGLIGVGY